MAVWVTLAVQAQEVQTNVLVNTTDVTLITKQGTHFYMGNDKLSHKELKGLMRNTSPELYKQYRTGYNLIGAGWYFVSSSAVALLSIGAAGISDLYATPNTFHCHSGSLLWATLICGPIAGGFTIIGVPMLCVGYAKRNKSIAAYNIAQIPKQPEITYQFTAGQNGIGFAINF